MSAQQQFEALSKGLFEFRNLTANAARPDLKLQEAIIEATTVKVSSEAWEKKVSILMALGWQFTVIGPCDESHRKILLDLMKCSFMKMSPKDDQWNIVRFT
jgi:hypothetical protein